MIESIPQEQFPWMAWLLRRLHSEDALTDDQLFDSAANQGWLTWQTHGFWSVDAAWAKSLPSDRAIIEHISTVDDAAYFAMSMGELSSGVNDFPLDECRKVLSESPGFQKSGAVFQRMGELAKESYPPVECDLDTLGISQFINSCRLDYNSFQGVSSCTDRPSSISTLRRYGLSKGMLIAALLDLKAFGLWLSEQNDPAVICPSTSQFPILFYIADQPVVVGLLGSGHPFLQLIGVMALHAYRDQDTTWDWHYPLKQAFAIIDESGITREDFVWTVFSRLEELERIGGRAKEIAEDQAKQGPDLAERTNESYKRWKNLVASFEDDMAILVTHYPKNGISEQHAGFILGVTRGQLDLPLRVAEKLPESAKRTLVHVIFKTFHSQAKIFNLENDADRFSIPYRWKQRARHAAHAFVQYHAGANIGRKFGSLAKRVEDVLVPDMQQPYLYYRRHNQWMHVFGRLGVLYYYTLEIAAAAELRNEEGWGFLAQHMATQTLELFKHYSGEYFTSLYDVLSLKVTNLFNEDLEIDILEKLRAFVDHPRGYSVAKLLVTWTRPELIEGNENRVMRLFRIFDEPPHDRDDQLERFSAYANIMDRAFIAAHKMENVSLSNKLVTDWEKRFSVWEPIMSSKWSVSAHWIQKALTGDDEGYAWLCKQPEFDNSMCRRYCEEARNGNLGRVCSAS